MKHLLMSGFAAMLLLIQLASCSQFNDDSNPYDVTEPLKELSGEWKIQSVIRNGTDITQNMDFSQFTLKMNDDGTYHIDNYLPFVVRHDGQWKTDDPQYPFRLTFLETAGSPTTVDINAPIQQGLRVLTIQLSPGCSGNSYTYTLQRKQ